jgi:hypothetical protein
VRIELDLLDEHRFGGGVVHLHYGFRGQPPTPLRRISP